MSYDAHSNGAYSTVLTAPSPSTSGTSLVVQSADGTRFPAVPFNATVFPAGAQPLFANGANAEIVRVTAVSTDTFTITRTQEGTSARSIVVGDQIVAGVTAKTLTDVQVSAGAAASYVATTETTTSVTYADLATTTDTVTVTIGTNGLALVSIYCGQIYNNTSGQRSLAGFAVSGASTVAAADTQAVMILSTGVNVPQIGIGATFLLTGLTAGSTTFKMKYKTTTASTGSFTDRRISVIPL